MSYLSLTILLAFLACGANGLECYSCAMCHGSSGSTQVCSAREDVCAKDVILEDEAEEGYGMRSCATRADKKCKSDKMAATKKDASTDKTSDMLGSFLNAFSDKLLQTYCCDTDMCNSGLIKTPSFGVLASLAVVAVRHQLHF